MRPRKIQVCSLSLILVKTARFLTTGVLATVGLLTSVPAQVNVVTYHYDNARTAQNVNETLLNPTNVNKGSFGFRFSQPVDGYIVGEPLYLSNVTIPGVGKHNVVYVATLNDSVYAFDADSNTGANAAPLWQVNFTNPAAGITTASGAFLPCQLTTGYSQSGIVSTPVIDPNSGTIFVVAKTNENGTVYHRLHALDVATGVEKLGAGVAIGGSTTAPNGAVVTFNSLHAMNRPALLLDNGTVYIAFGSNGCNDQSHGWVLAYDATSLMPVGIYNAEPEQGLASIWQTGSGPAADASGNVYVSTAEGLFDANTGGPDFGSSILKLVESAWTLSLADYFTPYNQAIISKNDADLSACGVMVLPDQPGPSPHVLVASGKQGTVYVLDRDNMGQYNPLSDSQILQELPLAVGAMFSSPAYWNNTVYFTGDAHPVSAYALSNGLLATPPVARSITMPGSHSPTISANGNANAVLWVIEGSQLWALDAVSLKVLYNTSQSGTRDLLPAQPHFSTQTVANGKVYVGTQTSLMVLGLLPSLAVASGNNQSAPATTTLPVALQVQLTDPYTQQVIPGVTVSFSDGGKGGTFGNASPVTDATGTASTTYTVGKIAQSITISASNAGVLGLKFSETATSGPARWVVLISGGNQSAQVTTTLPKPVVAKVSALYGNGVPGVSVTFADGGASGSFSADPVTTNSLGQASTTYTTSTKAGPVNIIASAAGLNPLKVSETATAGSVAAVTVIAGNNQTATAGTELPQALTVQVMDQYGNPVPGASVMFTDGSAGGSFSISPVTSNTSGQASSSYTTPSNAGTVGITASVGSASATFTATAQ